MMGVETFQVGVYRRAGVGSRINCCTFYVFEILLRESNSQPAWIVLRVCSGGQCAFKMRTSRMSR